MGLSEGALGGRDPLNYSLSHPQRHRTATSGQTSLLHSGRKSRKRPGDRAATASGASPSPAGQTPASCTSLVNPITCGAPVQGGGGARPRRTGRRPGCSLTLPGAPLHGRSLHSAVAQTLTGTTGLLVPPHLMTRPPRAQGTSPGTTPWCFCESSEDVRREQREGERSGPREP